MGFLGRFLRTEVYLKILASFCLALTLANVALYEHPTHPPLYISQQDFDVAENAKHATLAPGEKADDMPGKKPALGHIKMAQLAELAVYGITTIGGLVALAAIEIVMCRVEEHHHLSVLFLIIYAILCVVCAIMATAFIIIHRNDKLVDWRKQISYVICYALAAIFMIVDGVLEILVRCY